MYYEKTETSVLLYKGRFLDFVEHDVIIEANDPLPAKRQFFIHPGGVCVVPMHDDGRIVLVKQFRKPLERVFLEIPAGKIDPGETDTLNTGKRELQEETGYTAKTWIKLGQIIPCPGYCTEILHLYLAKDLEAGSQNLDHGEFVEVVELKIDEAIKMIHRNEIQDSKTINAIFMAKHYL